MRTRLFAAVWIAFAFLLGATSCDGKGSKGQQNDIEFSSIDREEQYHLMDNSENPNCNLEIKFTYPTHLGKQALLPELQKQFVSAYFGEKYEPLTPEKAVQQYIEDYLAAYKELEVDFLAEKEKASSESMTAWYSYFEMSQNEIIFNQGGILSYTVYFENYTGGSHGGHATNHYVIDLNTAKPLTEEDLFVDGFAEPMAQILVDQIAKQNDVTDPKELENLGFFSIDEIFPNGNFLVDDKGITYSFNEYEIAAYAVGLTQVTLPYAEIRHLLRDDSPIAAFID